MQPIWLCMYLRAHPCAPGAALRAAWDGLSCCSLPRQGTSQQLRPRPMLGCRLRAYAHACMHACGDWAQLRTRHWAGPCVTRQAESKLAWPSCHASGRKQRCIVRRAPSRGGAGTLPHSVYTAWKSSGTLELHSREAMPGAAVVTPLRCTCRPWAVRQRYTQGPAMQRSVAKRSPCSRLSQLQ